MPPVFRRSQEEQLVGVGARREAADRIAVLAMREAHDLAAQRHAVDRNRLVAHVDVPLR